MPGGLHPQAATAAVLLVLAAACAESGPAPAGAGAPEVVGTAAPEYAEAISAATALVEELMAEQLIPGLSAAVSVGSQLVWSQGFGYADLTHQVPVTPAARFRVGSVAKPFTAAAVAVLVERGQLDLDAPVQDYAPAFPEKRYEVTTRMLAGHLGGVRHYRDDEFLSRTSYPDVVSGLAIFSDEPLVHIPGTEYLYSTYGWNLISAVVEGAAGEPFLAFMQREVFDPLGMEHTVADQVQPVISNRTRFYERGPGGVVNAPYVDNSNKWAGGGFLSTAEDMIDFAHGHMEAGYLAAETLELLFTSQATADGRETGYGIGWSTTANDRGERVVSHGGGSVGGRTALRVNLDADIVVAMTANLTSAPMSMALAARVEELFRE